MSNNPDIKKDLWAALSVILLFGFFNLVFFMAIELNLSYLTTSISIIFTILIIPSIFLFLELTGLRKNIWDFWKNVPKEIHKWIIVICSFWLFVLISKVLIPFIKNNYGNEASKSSK